MTIDPEMFNSPVNRFGSYQLVSEPSILGFGGVDQKMKKKTEEEEELELELLHEDFTALNKKMKQILSMMKNFMNESQKSNVGTDGVHDSIQEVLFASNQRELEEKEFEQKAPKHFAIEGNFAPLSLHQTNSVESSISRGEVMVDELRSIGECNDLEKYDALPCQESIIEIQPNVFDKMPQRLKGEQLFGELPMSDYIEKEPQMFEEMPTMMSLGTQNRNCSRNAHSYILVNDSSIAGKNWGVKGAEFITIPVMLKVFSVCDVKTSKIGIVVIEHKSIRRVDMVYKLIYRFGKWLQGNDANTFSWIEWLDLPLPPPEPPPSQPL